MKLSKRSRKGEEWSFSIDSAALRELRKLVLGVLAFIFLSSECSVDGTNPPSEVAAKWGANLGSALRTLGWGVPPSSIGSRRFPRLEGLSALNGAKRRSCAGWMPQGKRLFPVRSPPAAPETAVKPLNPAAMPTKPMYASPMAADALPPPFADSGALLSAAPGRVSGDRPESPTGGIKRGLTTRSHYGSLMRERKPAGWPPLRDGQPQSPRSQIVRNCASLTDWAGLHTQRRMAGGESRLGTGSTYMLTLVT